MEIITNDLTVLQAPPAPKRWKNIWKHELESAINENQDLLPPDYNDIKRQRKRKKPVIKSKRKIKKNKKRER